MCDAESCEVRNILSMLITGHSERFSLSEYISFRNGHKAE